MKSKRRVSGVRPLPDKMQDDNHAAEPLFSRLPLCLTSPLVACTHHAIQHIDLLCKHN